MSVMTKFTLKSLKAHKIRTLVTIAGVALAAALFTAVLACVTSLNGFLLRAEVAMSGDWTAKVYTNTLDEAVQGVENDPAIQNSFIYTDVGFVAQPEASQDNFGRYLCIESVQGSRSLIALEMEEGRFPENAQEIILPTRFIGETMFGEEDVQVGSTLTLSVGDRKLIALDDETSGYTMGFGEHALDGTELAYSFDVGDLLNSSQSFVGSRENGSSLGEELVNEREHTYTVVGFYGDQGYAGLAESGNYAALTFEDSEAQGFSIAYVHTEGLNSRAAIVGSLESAFDSDYVFLHDSYLRYLGIVSDRSLWSSLQSIAMILGTIIAVACIVLVSNAFAISVTERIKQFGLLASLGATKKQLAWSVMEEALIIALVGVPLGVLIGLGATALTLTILSPSIMEVLGTTRLTFGDESLAFSLVVNGKDLALAALVTTLVVVVSAAIPALRAATLNPIDAIRNVSQIRTTKSDATGTGAARKPWSGGISRVVFGIPGKIAALNTQRSKGRNVVVSLSLALAVVLLMTGGVVSTTFGTMLDAIHLEQNYDIVVVGGVEDTQAHEEIIAESYDEMCDTPGVTGLGWSLESPVLLTLPPAMLGSEALSNGLGDDLSKTYISQASDPIEAVALISFVDDESYKAWLAANSIDEQMVYDALAQGKLAAVGVTEGYGNDGSKYVYKRLFNQPGETTVLFPGSYSANESVNDFFYDFQGGTIIPAALDTSGDSTEVYEVASLEVESIPLDVVALASTRPKVMNQGSDTLTIVAPMSALDLLPDYALTNDSAKFRAAFDAEDSAAATDSIAQVAEEVWTDLLPGFYPYIDNVADRMKSTALLSTVVNVFCLLFTGVLMLIALASLFTTITNNLVLRAREFAVLQSVGMGPGDFRKMIMAECVGYGVRGIIPGLIVAALVSVALYYALDASIAGLTYVFPWNYAALAVGLIAFMMVISVAYGMHCLKAQTPAETLSGE